jgi:hypothetical protein
VAGDPEYGHAGILGLTRQFLHAARLAFAHPVTGAPLEVRSPLPADLAAALERADRPARGRGCGRGRPAARMQRGRRSKLAGIQFNDPGHHARGRGPARRTRRVRASSTPGLAVPNRQGSNPWLR